ncbi:MAG: LLM class flavin-dependent oxidoreductase [Candidatus Binatia bacterium]
MKFGIQLNPQVSIEKRPETLLSTLVEQVRVADSVGFEAVSMGQHYNIPGYQRLHQVPLLARLCGELRRCAVGTATTLLGLHHPVATAKELATLDVMNEGRSFFSFGLGYRQQELDAFGLTKRQRFRRFVEGIEIIKRLWMEDEVSFSGREFVIRKVTISPKPLQKPRPAVWIAANGDRGVCRAARIGDGWLIGPHSAIEEVEGQARLFRKTWVEADKPAERASLVMIRECFVAPTRDEAVEKARPYLEKLYRNIYVEWGQDEAMKSPGELKWNFDKLAQHRFVLGSPKDCISEIKAYEKTLDVALMLVRFDWTPGLPQEDILAAIELFGHEVIPHFSS